MIFVLFPTICHLFHNFICFCSSMFFYKLNPKGCWITFTMFIKNLKIQSPDHYLLMIYISLSLSLSIYIYIYTHTHIYIYTYIYIYIYIQWRYSPGWASASFKSLSHPSRFTATIFQFLHPSLATSSSTLSSQRSLVLHLGRFPPSSLRRTPLDKSSSSCCMTCPAHLSLLILQNFTMSSSPHSW